MNAVRILEDIAKSTEALDASMQRMQESSEATWAVISRLAAYAGS